MNFVKNVSLFAAVKKFYKSAPRTDKVIAMVKLAQFLTHGVETVYALTNC